MREPFNLPPLPPRLDIEPYFKLIIEARDAVSRYDEAVKRLPNPMIIRHAFETKEAVSSSAIEGTQTTFEDVLALDATDHQAEKTERDQDYREVINYRKAINVGQEILSSRPLGENEIKSLHRILLDSSRGRNRAPGEFRRSQVYLGRPGSSLEEATFVPPAASEVPHLFSNLVQYMQDPSQADLLVQAAVAHYQFESIHPFYDGNGRTGRLIIPLYLYEKGLTSYPNLYVSEFFEKYKSDYYSALNSVRFDDDGWNAWIPFFLRAIRTQARLSLQRVNQIEQLRSRLSATLPSYGSRYASNFLQAIFCTPIFTASSIGERSNIENKGTVNSLIDKFLAAGVITDKTPGRVRGRHYHFTELLEIIDSDLYASEKD